MLGALGVVYGDIGTSPLYALQAVFAVDHGAVHATRAGVLSVISMLFWTITLVVSVKYVSFVMRADNQGEGGVLALGALGRKLLGGGRGKAALTVMVIGVLGASLFYGDSVITPAISVLSAVEGLRVSAPALTHMVVPLAAAILCLLFLVQRWGTHRVGSLFGPVMVVWFGAIGLAGFREVMAQPGVVAGLSPWYAALFVADHPAIAFVALGAVVLAVTGAEALYADMGHFGRAPIRRSWFAIVFPALTLNYLGQAGLLLRHPASKTDPFFLLLPGWARLAMVALATAATVIASQAVISGGFSVARQAVQLGFLPYLHIRHTSSHEAGQVYVPSVNWVLFSGVLALVLAFRSSEHLAAAYGVAVTGTFVITTSLFLVVARARWHWRRLKLVVAGLVFGGLELTLFASNLTKVPHGAWVPLLVAASVFTVMMTGHAAPRSSLAAGRSWKVRSTSSSQNSAATMWCGCRVPRCSSSVPTFGPAGFTGQPSAQSRRPSTGGHNLCCLRRCPDGARGGAVAGRRDRIHTRRPGARQRPLWLQRGPGHRGRTRRRPAPGIELAKRPR